MRRKEVLYAVIGGIVGAVLTMAVGSVMPIGAQNGDATFGEITCNRLDVVDAQGNSYVILSTHQGRSGVVGVYGKESCTAQLRDSEHGGQVIIRGKDGERGAIMEVDEYGGHVHVTGKGDDNSRAGMGVNEYGNGAVSTWDKNGYRLATLK